MDFHTHCRIVRRELVAVKTTVSCPKPFGSKTLSEEIEVHWLRESTATVILRHKGVTIDDKTNYCDAYGFTTCFSAALEEAQRLIPKFKIDEGP